MLAESPAEFLIPWSQAQQLRVAAVLDDLAIRPLPQGADGEPVVDNSERRVNLGAGDELFRQLFSHEPLVTVAGFFLAHGSTHSTSLNGESIAFDRVFPQELASPTVVIAGSAQQRRRMFCYWLNGLLRLLSQESRIQDSDAHSMEHWLGPLRADDLHPQLKDLIGSSSLDLATMWRRVQELQPISLQPVLVVAAGDHEDPRYRAQQNGLLSRIELILMRFDWEDDVEREKLASLKRLAYGASHEINNPLANIATRAQTLLRNENGLQRRQSLETINAQAFRAFDMLANLMHYAAPPLAVVQHVDLIALAKRSCREVQSHWLGQLEPEWSGGVESLEVEIDPTQISVMIQALLRNAWEACGPQGKVQLTVDRCTGDSQDDAWVAIRVLDNGPAVTANKLRIICDPFYSGREAGRGLGFGLAKSLRIAEAHGGYLAFEPQSPQGLQVTAYLPTQGRQRGAA